MSASKDPAPTKPIERDASAAPGYRVQVMRSRPPRPAGAKPLQIWISPDLDERLNKAIAGQRNLGTVALIEFALSRLEAENKFLEI